MDEVQMVKTSLHRVCPDIFPKPKGSVKMVGYSTKDNQSPVKGSKRKKTVSKKKGKKLKKSSGKKVCLHVGFNCDENKFWLPLFGTGLHI